jgi:hypothetical protein
MNKIKQEKIQKSIDLMFLFIGIFKTEIKKLNNNEIDEDSLIKKLKQQHEMNRYALEDLGCKFDITGQVRGLNESIRKLEGELAEKNNDVINLSNINNHISYIHEKINNIFEKDYGLNIGLNISVHQNMNVEINIYGIIDSKVPSYEKEYCNDEDEYQSLIENKKSLHELGKSLFDVTDDKSNRNYIVYSEKNIQNLIEIIKKVFSEYGLLTNIDYSIKNYFSNNNELTINKLDFTVISSESGINIHNAFKNR